MRLTNAAENQKSDRKKRVVRTTFFELVGALIDVTNNDAEIIASLRRIVDRSDARMVRSLAPIRLGSTESRARIDGKGKAVKGGPSVGLSSPTW